MKAKGEGYFKTERFVLVLEMLQTDQLGQGLKIGHWV